MATRTLCPIEVPERTSFRYRTTLLNEDGDPIVPPDLSALRLTLYAVDAFATIINGVVNVDILNTDRGTMGPQGRLTVLLKPEDTVILKAGANRTETRIMLIEATYRSGTGAARHEVQFPIRNLAKVV